MVEGVKYELEVYPIFSQLEGLDEHWKLPSGTGPHKTAVFQRVRSENSDTEYQK